MNRNKTANGPAETDATAPAQTLEGAAHVNQEPWPEEPPQERALRESMSKLECLALLALRECERWYLSDLGSIFDRLNIELSVLRGLLEATRPRAMHAQKAQGRSLTGER